MDFICFYIYDIIDRADFNYLYQSSQGSSMFSVQLLVCILQVFFVFRVNSEQSQNFFLVSFPNGTK